jgi:NAD(P)-dependent dehydrogenase (short-subunit alcohol dehydrogenase family)
MDFDAKTVMVTGAASGIGRGTAKAFAGQGAHVVLLDVDEVGLKAVAEECEILGATATTRRVDVTSSASVGSMMEEIVAVVERVDVLVNVAGIYPGVRLVDMTDELWRSVLDVNLTGTFHMCRELARHMLERGGGSIVNISSGASQIPIDEMSAYSASKGGVNAFSRTIALELAPTVRVNVVAPGLTDTNDMAAEYAHLTESVPLGRWAGTDEVAEAILFLASDRASFITGQTLFVSGGRIMH